MQMLRKDNGFTVAQLIEQLKKAPPDAEVWIETKPGITNQLKEVWPLNSGRDVCLEADL